MKTDANKKYKVEFNDGVEFLTRDEMTNALLEYFITGWVFSQDVDSLEGMMLFSGWKALDKYTNEELKSDIEGFMDKEQLEVLLSQREARWEAKIKAEEAKKNADYKEPEMPF